jgi:DNA-binding response OmpR family regulator
VFEHKILFADNDPDFLDTRAEFLEQAGYRVLKAYTLEQARQLLETAYVHLAILDIRMENEDDEKDISGLTLAKDPVFRTIPKIILTGYPSYQAVREALGPALDGLPPAADFLAKQEGPEALIQAVERAFKEHVRINQDLEIRWGENPAPVLVSRIEAELPAKDLPGRIEEVEDLLRKLFYDFEQVSLGRTFLTLPEQQTFLEALAYPRGTTGPLPAREFIVLCGRPQAVLQQERARSAVPQEVRPFFPRPEQRAETLHYAALACSLERAILEQLSPFDDFYWQHSDTEVAAALDVLLGQVLASWHRRGQFQADRPFLSLWQEGLQEHGEHLVPRKIQDCLKCICEESLTAGVGRVEYSPNRLTFHLAGGPTTLPNPQVFLGEKYLSVGKPVLCGPIHGRPDVHRILVDPRSQAWLLDLSWAGVGPLVRDFAVLENSIRFDLLEEADPLEWLKLERRLLQAKSLEEPIPAEDLAPSLQKATRAIGQVRSWAARTLGDAGHLYLFALLYEALERIARYELGVRHAPREVRLYVHILLSTAVLGEALDRPLPGPAGENFWLDEENREVWVEGRRIPLTEQEFKVLRYMYHRRGKLCRKRAIVEEALGEHYEDSILERDRLISLMSRLREKIEPSPGGKKYLLTVRGAGYKLDF